MFQVGAVQPVHPGVDGVQLAFEAMAALLVPLKRRAFVTEIAGEGFQFPGGEGQLQNLGGDDLGIGGLARRRGLQVGLGRKNGELFDQVEVEVCAPYREASRPIQREAVHVGHYQQGGEGTGFCVVHSG